MKNATLTIILLFLALVSYPDRYITRGPNTGEIYFLGATYTGEGLYYSTDHGLTAYCVDSTITEAMRITAGLTPGVVYYVTMGQALYISYDYGNQGTWQYRNSDIKLQINSGVVEGHIYSSFNKHSEDYGINFINHNSNGFFGSKKDVEIDNDENVGYVIVDKFGVNDSVYLLISNDNFDNLEIQKVLSMHSGAFIHLSRGNNNGELYLLNYFLNSIFFTSSYGNDWIKIITLNNKTGFSIDMVGGRTEGEIYFLYRFINMMGQNAHTYILHSTDYGVTFELFHPFSKGQEPLLANFSAKTEGGESIKDIDSIYYVTGEMPLDVEFYNYSIGDVNSYEWDFNNDGTIDSYEENPVYTYSDTGWYSVNLTVYDDYDTNSFVKENYIYVYKLTDVEENIDPANDQICCNPNPFSKQITITLPRSNISKTNELIIFSNTGKIIKCIKSNNKEIIWDGTNHSGNKCLPGIYYITSKNRKYSSKILLTD